VNEPHSNRLLFWWLGGVAPLVDLFVFTSNQTNLTEEYLSRDLIRVS